MKRFLLISCVLMLVLFSINGQGSKNDTAKIHSISVINEEGHVLIEWSFDEPDSIDGFMVYDYDPTKFPETGDAFDTIYDSFATSYIDERGKADSSSAPYTVAAIKIGDHNLQSPPHFTIFLEPDWQECSSSIKLNWTPYIGWNTDSMYYRIFENGIPIDTTKNTFYYTINAENNTAYHYRVEALNTHTGWTSSSNYISINTDFPIPTEYINADYATVDGDAISLSFSLGDNGNVYDYYLLAKPPGSQIFSDTLNIFTYANQIDTNFLVDNVTQPYQFKLVERDRCGRYVKESNISSNIVLKGERADGTINLNWNEYLDWLGGVENYRVYRSIGNGFAEVGRTNDFSFRDDISSFVDDYQITVIRYYVEAEETSGNPHLIIGESRSNLVEFFFERPLKFPTAFTPNDDGTNDVFRPIPADLNYVPEDYSMLIFDRWGKKVFESNRVDDGWDGTFASGKRVAEGVYHYYVEYKDLAGNERKQTGIITVLYP